MPTPQAAVLTDLASRGGSSSPMDGRGRAQRGTGAEMAEVMEMQEQFPVHAKVNAPPNITPARTPADPAPAVGLPITPSDQRDALILAVVRASSDTRTHAAAHRRALQAQARHLTGFEHFRRLALSDMHTAFHHDRHNATRTAKNHRRTWLALFRYFAKLQGIQQELKITALDRQGNYACKLTDPTPGADPWIKLVRLAREFGITEKALTALWQSEQERRSA